jgi:hypothetical protein
MSSEYKKSIKERRMLLEQYELAKMKDEEYVQKMLLEEEQEEEEIERIIQKFNDHEILIAQSKSSKSKSPEERDAHNKKRNEQNQIRINKMSSEDKKAYHKQKNEPAKERRNNMSPEEKDAYNKKQNEQNKIQIKNHLKK